MAERYVRCREFGATALPVSAFISAVARMEPTGRANARPMTGSAQSGAGSSVEITFPDFALLHPGYRLEWRAYAATDNFAPVLCPSRGSELQTTVPAPRLGRRR